MHEAKNITQLERASQCAPEEDRETFETIEAEKGRGAYIQELQETLQAETYLAQPVKRVEIPKANGETRPLGIPCIKDRIVQMAVKLIIEPIFEADFSPHSYGFRPQRSAHQAMDDITTGLLQGHVQVIDADLSKYFDMIPHDKLLKTVAERISDGTLLSLIKQWLKVVVIKEEKGKRTHVGGGKKARKGTPQGGVVILCARETTIPYAILQTILGKLELKLNEEKTQIRDSRVEKFGFLGFSIGVVKSEKSGKNFPMIEPSDKAMQAIKQKIKYYTRREMNPVPIDDIVGRLNQTVRGWSNYFHYGHSHRKMKKIKYYMEESLRLHLRYRHKLNN